MQLDNPLVSIIIPTFNRAHLIGETLDSIIAQTYTNWECIVVDDGSTDDTALLISQYYMDSRIKLFVRPKESFKGANTCRNIGLIKSEGKFIIFFDSDDLMTPDHLTEKVKPLLTGNFDFSIAKTRFFDSDDDSLDHYYKFEEYEITAYNYIVQNINWLTYDICIKADVAKNIEFNPILQSGQEFNYFSKLVVNTVNCVTIDKYLTLRRKHEDSIRHHLKKTKKTQEGYFFSMWETYKDIKFSLSEKTKKELLFKCIRVLYERKRFFVKDKIKFFRELHSVFGSMAFYFFPMMIIRRHSNGGYFIREKFKNKTFNK